VVHQAAASLDLRYLKLILEHGADVNSRNHSPGVTPLHLAASIGDREKCALLIKYRADVNIPSDRGATPLMFAAFWGYRPVCELLLANGAELDFYSACALGRLSDVKKMLADRPELATLRERHLLRPPLLWAAAGGNVEIVELLLKNGADVKARAHRVIQGHDASAGPYVWGDESDEADAHQTALHAAATAGHAAVIKLLLDKGAELKEEDYDKDTALRRAADQGHAAATKVLLDAYPEPDIEVERDSFIACAIKSPPIMKLVLALKPTPQTLQYALVESSEVNPEVAELLLAHGVEAGLRTACILGKTKRVAELLADEPPVPDVKPQYDLVGKWQFATLAAQYGRVDTVAWFIDHGLDLTVWGEESLLKAIEGGHAKVVKLLLDKGVKIPARTLNLKPMLNLAASTGSVEVARLLIANGCNVNSEDDRQVTPLHVAALKGHAELVEFLLKSAADANATDRDGQTPLAALDSETDWNTGDDITYNPAVIKLLRIYGGVR
jgi:ankyrin repeat protein